eukprot:6213509-Pleurochrysis_carterae.AAC.1
MTRETHTAHGNGARPHSRWCFGRTARRLYAICAPSPPARTAPLSAHCKGLRGQAVGERNRRQRRAQPYSTRRPLRSRLRYSVAASHRLTVERHRRRNARRSHRVCAGDGWPMRPASLGSTASHAAYAQLTLLH